jgi:EAL and modified HD-GYP domain-containing signal transduction protein
MEVYLARQPILDRACNVAGYELLFRSSRVNLCDCIDGVAATSQVIVNAVLGVGLDRLLGNKPAFINFDRTLLLGDWTTLLGPDRAVIEILETVSPGPEVLSVCNQLKQQGYTLALDDCLDDERTAAFAPFVDILKVDFQQTPPAEQERMVRRYHKLNLKVVAEKVETETEFRRALQFGYDYYQGYFFARPTVLQGSRIPASQINSLRLMKLLQREEMDFQAVETLIRHDVAFSYSLLTYLNSAVFHWAARIESVRQGLLLLGSTRVRQWAWMASLTTIGPGTPRVLVGQVLMRGRFCELIANSAQLSFGGADPFLVGMFSLLDALLRRPLRGILDDLNISTEIRDVLLGNAGEDDALRLTLEIVKAYETGEWSKIGLAAAKLHVSTEVLSTLYLESLTWVESVHPHDDPPAVSSRRSSVPMASPAGKDPRLPARLLRRAG